MAVQRRAPSQAPACSRLGSRGVQRQAPSARSARSGTRRERDRGGRARQNSLGALSLPPPLFCRLSVPPFQGRSPPPRESRGLKPRGPRDSGAPSANERSSQSTRGARTWSDFCSCSSFGLFSLSPGLRLEAARARPKGYCRTLFEIDAVEGKGRVWVMEEGAGGARESLGECSQLPCDTCCLSLSLLRPSRPVPLDKNRALCTPTPL